MWKEFHINNSYIVKDLRIFFYDVLKKMPDLLKDFSYPDLGLNFTQNLETSIIGGLVGYFSIWSIIQLYYLIKKIEGMGLGDAKLMAGIGLLFGWQSIPFILFVSAILGLLLVELAA